MAAKVFNVLDKFDSSRFLLFSVALALFLSLQMETCFSRGKEYLATS